jgi:hypothetical protein
MKQQLIQQIEELEVKIDVYCDLWGPSSQEVTTLQARMQILSYKLLDMMVDDNGF